MKRKRDLTRRILTVLLTIVMIMPYCTLALGTSAVTEGENTLGDQSITENGGTGTYFSALPILEDETYTVSFYKQNPENPEITDPAENLIKEFTGVAFNTPLSDLADQLDEEYSDTVWTVSPDDTVVNDLSVWQAGEAVAAIGGDEYETLQEAINAAAEMDNPATILLLKDTTESIISTASYTLDMQGHTITAPANSRVYEINGGTVTMKNGTLTGGYNADANGGAGLRVSAGSAELINCTITDNHTGNYPLPNMPSFTYGSNGGGLYATNGTSVTLTNCTISNNTTASGYLSSGNGGGLYADSSATVMLTDCAITKNTAAGNGGGCYVSASATLTLTRVSISENISSAGSTRSGGGGIYASGSTIRIEDSDIFSNQSNAIAAVCLMGSAELTMENSRVYSNKGNVTNATTGIIHADGSCTMTGCDIYGNEAYDILKANSSVTVSLENCKVYENTSHNSVIFVVKQATLTLASTEVLSNTVSEGAPIRVKGESEGKIGTLYLTDNTIVTGNSGSMSGGIYVENEYGAVEMTGGAVYENQVTGEYSLENANDIYVPESSAGATVKILAASGMKDGDNSFDGYVWFDGTDSTSIEGAFTLPAETAKEYKLTAIPNPGDGVAQIKISDTETVKFQTVQAAVDYAKENDADEIQLISNIGYTIEDVIIPDGLTVTIDMNGKKLIGRSEGLVVSSDAALTITGDSGAVETKSKTGSAITNNGSLTIDGPVEIAKIRLGKDKFITAGAGFAPEALTLELDDEVLASLNNDEAETPAEVTLVVPAEETELSDELAKAIQITGASNIVVVEKNAEGNIIARPEKLNGVFVDGASGSDETGDGSLTNPVKTFGKAKEILKAKRDAGEDIDTIYVIGTIDVTGEETWTLEKIENAKLVRYPTFEGALVNITKDGTLTLTDITIDGMGDRTEAGAALIDTYGTLNITKGTVLQNNLHTKSGSAGYTKSGGAVYCKDGTVTMTGGTITDNTSWYGGGIELWGGSMTMSGGSIEGNHAEAYAGCDPAGGGIAVLDDATLTLSGGTIQYNSSAYDGGGISLGAPRANTVNGPELTMTGGTVDGNKAALDGGGIMLQSTAKATISGGNISYNCCDGAQEGYGIFGGGGIYVNGARRVSGNDYAQAELYLTNVLITDNKSDNRGGGLAACNTSDTRMYLTDGGAIYGNAAQDDSQVYIEFAKQSGLGDPNMSVSEYMLGGGIYHWTDALTGNAVPATVLQGEEKTTTGYALNNAPEDAAKAAASAKAQVTISGNTSGSHGGGIGSNGLVQIGTDTSDLDIPVTKSWDYAETDYARPETVRVWLLRNGERVSHLDFSQKADGTWPETGKFTNQPEKDAEGNAYTYTLEEEQLKGDGSVDSNHIYTITENEDGEFTVTNRLRREIMISKEIVNTVSGKLDKTFAFTISLKVNRSGFNGSLPAVYTGKDGEEKITLTFSNGTASFTLGHNESILIQDVPSGAEYSVTETAATGYQSKVEGKAEGTAAVGRTVIRFTNTYSAAGKAEIPVVKILTGRKWKLSDSFEVVLQETTQGAIQDKLTANQKIKLTKVSQSGAFVLNYTAEGVHTYKITETEKNKKGITTDTSIYTVTVTVTDNRDGTLTAETEIKKTKDGQTDEAVVVVFENIYKAPEDKPSLIPNTGDETPITLYLTLLMTSTVLLAGIGFRRLRRNKK